MKLKTMAFVMVIIFSLPVFAKHNKPFAARSILVNCHNLTNVNFQWVSSQFTHGIVSHHDALNKDLYPPMSIPANSISSWASESSGVMTGTEGNVSYKILDGRNSSFYFHWNNHAGCRIKT